MLPPMAWGLLGGLGAFVVVALAVLARRAFHRWRYGQAIAHDELLVQYGRHLASLPEREAVARFLAGEVSAALSAARALVLLVDGRDLVPAASEPGGPVEGLSLPLPHAAVRWVASGGEAVPVRGRLADLIAQGRSDLGWTAAWVPLMRGSTLHGLWLLGRPTKQRAYAPEDLRWLTALARQAAVLLETIRYAEQEQWVAHEMQALYRQAVAARESERGRLSRDLHDGVLQDLCAVARDLKALEAQESDGRRFAGLAAQSGDAVAALRSVCHDLRPPLLSKDPRAALKALVERLDALSPAPVTIEVSAGEMDLPEETSLAIYRIAQEALHNAIQHADASEITVRLTLHPDRLRLAVSDDGCGIADVGRLRRFVAKGHYGLAGMRERAAMIGGTLDLHSAPDYGTAVILEVPLEQDLSGLR